jgi:flagellar biosynthetic protein FliQ
VSGTFVLAVVREGLLIVLVASAPALLASLVAGLAISILQAATQVQDQTLSFVPKLVAVLVALAVGGAWMGGLLVRFARGLFEAAPGL